MSRALLRSLPGIDTWLESQQGELLCAEYSREEVLVIMRSHLARIRGKLENGGGELPALDSEEYTNLLRADLLARRVGSLKPVINATGIVIHTNLGRAPLADEAIVAMTEVSRGYANLEYDLASGERGSRIEHVADLLTELTGAEEVLVVNNCAAAVFLVLRVLAKSREVVVSRGELIEIGGSFRMPDVIAESGARMVEVGTTNRTTLKDYETALTENTRVLLTSHPSNYRIVGFTASAPPGDLAALSRDRGLALVRDLGSGSLCRLEKLGMSEPTVAECIADGADIVTFSGDKLLGGPQAGIIVGRKDLLDAISRHPLARAMRIDKLSLAALAATLRLYRPPNDPFERVPVLSMLGESREKISSRAAELVAAVEDLDNVTASLVDGVGYAGGGALPMSELPSRLVRLDARGTSATELARRLREASSPVICRLIDESVNLDLRTVLPRQTQELIGALRAATR